MIRHCIFLVLAPAALLADVSSRRAASPPPPGVTPGLQRLEDAKNDYRHALVLAGNGDLAGSQPEAARFCRKAAEAGYAPAEFEMGRFYATGFGVPLDMKQAALWYRKAAGQGDAEAQNNLGALYAKGQGVHRSASQAVHWYRLAAGQNDPEATSNLGIMYLRGRGVKRNPLQAFQFFSRAAEMGYATAQNNLALMYANGQGVGRDFVLAYAWLELASKTLAGAERLREEVGKQMSAEQLERARGLARQIAGEVAETRRQAK